MVSFLFLKKGKQHFSLPSGNFVRILNDFLVILGCDHFHFIYSSVKCTIIILLYSQKRQKMKAMRILILVSSLVQGFSKWSLGILETLSEGLQVQIIFVMIAKFQFPFFTLILHVFSVVFQQLYALDDIIPLMANGLYA